LDFPLPMIHKTVMIGGITAVQQQGDEWNSILDARNLTVLVSFGSMARSADMPETHKRALLEVFASMPDVTFIWKFEGEDLKDAATYPNVQLKPWVPQQQLLGDNRLALFLTHGGIASTYEIAYSGKPAIVVPIFGDQMRNAHMLTRHGGALYLDKSSISNAVQYNRSICFSYALNAQRLALQLRHQPVSPRELLLKHAEFAARFGQLPNLDPYGRHLSLFQYYLIDIALIILVAVLVFMAATGLLIKKCCISRSKTKTE
uniref:glucuronosyltransferase n=1 Tax=Heligmosomoides polygyrus TaxID=6339 RepID=A0A8L8K983_HELPZ